MEFNHNSVLRDEAINYLNIDPEGCYVDGTLGGGGHALEIVKRLKGGRLIGIDRDCDAICAAQKRVEEYRDKVTIIKDNFSNITSILKSINIDKVNGILLDLGVSSYQLDEEKRGFSYMADTAPLDMRMDRDSSLTAKDVINDYEYTELVRILKVYGEERFASNIAHNICTKRLKKQISTTGELNAIIDKSIPAKYQKKGSHNAKRTYQALRIEVNGELDGLDKTINDMIDLLEDNGRLCIITFHSLEDRIVKNAFKVNERPCICPSEFPVCACGRISKGEVVTRKPILPSDLEIQKNSRSRSAKLRVFKRCVVE